MTTHVFIVNKESFPFHLKYSFAGTGAADKAEHIGLLADICRVRIDDPVIFYLESVGFYGLFKIAGAPFIDTDVPTYLESVMGKKLIYRVPISPHTVYPLFVSEWEALDRLPLYAKDVIWSLIYRKLKGNRGCTPITLQESDNLMKFIANMRGQQPALSLSEGEYFRLDPFTFKLEKSSGAQPYLGRMESVADKMAIMEALDSQGRAYEDYLQAYFTVNIGRLPKLDSIAGRSSAVIWLGNEVSCGVGMQKIDIFTITSDDRENRTFNLIELKCISAYPSIIDQLRRYVLWTGSYITGAINANIQPIIVSRKIENGTNRITGRPLKRKTLRDETAGALIEFNRENLSKKVKWFEYYFQDHDIFFEEVSYE